MINPGPFTDTRLIINTKHAVIFTPNVLNGFDNDQHKSISSTIIRDVNIFNLHVDGH